MEAKKKKKKKMEKVHKGLQPKNKSHQGTRPISFYPTTATILIANLKDRAKKAVKVSSKTDLIDSV